MLGPCGWSRLSLQPCAPVFLLPFSGVSLRLPLPLAHSSSPAKIFALLFLEVLLCMSLRWLFLPEQMSSAGHPPALRRNRLPPSWPAQWLLLNPHLLRQRVSAAVPSSHSWASHLLLGPQCSHLWNGDFSAHLSVML